MSIHILTTDKHVSEQLEQLLAGGQQAFKFYNDLELLISALPKLKKTDKVFYDLQLEPSLMAFDALRFGSAKTNLIAFEPLRDGEEVHRSNCPKKAKHYFVLSSDTRKAGTRLNQLLHDIDASAAKKKRPRKKASDNATGNSQQSPARDSRLPVTLSRYLTAKSEAMQQLLAKLTSIAKEPGYIFLAGEDGADFELTAREINFRANGDASPLHIVDPMRVEINEIRSRASKEDSVNFCYLGLSYELGAMTIARLREFLIAQRGEKKTNDVPYFILGHVEGSESYLEDEVKALIKNFRGLSEEIELPNMSDRREDISLIAQSIFTTLRTAHPFLITRTLSKDAISYLEDNCENLSYSGLVRNMRNAMALTERDTLTSKELKNFGDDSPTAQHLVESLADEKFFKKQNGVA